MASDDAKKAKASPKTETTPKNISASDASTAKAEGAETATGVPPPGYSRGEGQKPVSKAYRDNWKAIFAKKKKR